MNDTICAISTALGVGAISIIRVSGDEAIDIVNKIFDKDLTKKESHTINYGHIVYNDEIIDEVMVSIMKSPKTFTKEDIVEINSHGGVAVTNKVLEILLLEGARLAEPGEFTKRAFLNGRIDLVEAESIMDLIESKTETSRKLAISGMEGKVSKLVKNIIDNLVKVNANIEVNIDYPEYEDIEIVTKEKIEEMSKYINKELTKLLNESENGKLIKDGINTLILGRPNVGKSSILNKLIEEDKAIVTSVAGTTRDIVEGQIRVNGILLNIIDTAGVRETEDIVEKIGVEKSLSLVNDADLIILVFNNNEKLTDEDKKLLEYTKEKKRIIVINKIDLDNNLDISNLKNERIVKISALKDSGIESLKNEINDMFNLEEINLGDFTYLSNSRQISLVKKAVEISKNLEDALNNDVPIDLLEIDIKEICGCALANVLIKNHNVKIWSFKKKEADVINNEHRCMFIDNSKLDERIVCYTNYEDVIEDSEYLILVTPSSVIRNTCQNIKKYVTNKKIIIASKGMEIETNKFLIDIVKEELDLKYIGVISGPSIAKEVINDMGLKVVFASNNSDYNNEIKNNFETNKFKIELSDDVIGTELGGTLKNIISIASGLVNGLNLGNNMNAILITKGLEEIKKIGLKLGAKEETFYGLSSLGDLLTTCLSNESRNNRCGILLSQGKKIDEIKEEIGMVIEGLDALKIAYNISQKYNINTKIINTLYDIIYSEKNKESIIDAVLN